MILFAVMACTLAKDTLVNLANKDPKVLQSLFKSFQHTKGRHYANRSRSQDEAEELQEICRRHG